MATIETLTRTWSRIRKPVIYAFMALVIFLVIDRARDVEWAEVFNAMVSYEPWTLLRAGALALCSYFLFMSYDLLARHYTGHQLPTVQVLAVSFISYTFNLNLGALIGGVGFRYLLYSIFGLPARLITRIVGFAVFTNWTGYVLLMGFIFAFLTPTVLDTWRIGPLFLKTIGFAFLAVTAAYIGFCAFSLRREWRIGKVEISLPSVKFAFVQLLLSSLNWMAIAGIIFVLLNTNVSYVRVLTVLMLSGIAAAMTHIPAGLGVLEAVFITFLGDQIPNTRIIAALLAYRAIYYLIPLLIASVSFIALQAKVSAQRHAFP